MCELLMRPLKHYNRWDKFFRALEKTLSIVTTVDPLGGKEAKRGPGSEASQSQSSEGTPTPRLDASDRAAFLSSSSSIDTLVLPSPLAAHSRL